MRLSKIVRVIRVVQRENIFLRFLRRGHAGDGRRCNRRVEKLNQRCIKCLISQFAVIETKSPEGTFCHTVQVPSDARDMQII